MTLWLIILLSIAWYVLGMSGFIYWWIKTSDLTTKEFPVLFFVGILGIFSWLVGWAIHSDKNTIVIRKRN